MTGANEGRAEVIASLLSGLFNDTLYERYYGTQDLMSDLLAIVDDLPTDITPPPEQIETLLRAHFSDDEPSLRLFLQAIDGLASDPKYADYRFAPDKVDIPSKRSANAATSAL